MKRIYSLLLVAVLAMSAMGQSPVYRNGNHYFVNGENMDQRAFRGYLQNNSPVAFERFNSGQKIATAGWALFGTGLGIEAVGNVLMQTIAKKSAGKTAEQVYQGLSISQSIISLGSATVASGIACLGVGYARMHRAADLYNVETAYRKGAEFTLSMGENGVGLTCKF